MRAEAGKANKSGHGVPMHFFLPAAFSLLIALVLSLCGCVTPQKEAPKLKASKQTIPAQPAIEPADAEQAQPQKQETLAAVEEFLSRTQEYRLPLQGESKNATESHAPNLVPSNATLPAGAAKPQPTAPMVRDAAYANSQISLGEQPAPVTPQAIPAIESVSIRSGQPKSPVPPAPAKPKTTNGPLEVQSHGANDSMDLLVASLKKELNEEKNAAAEWKLRMILLGLGRDAEEAGMPDHAPPELKGILPAWSAASTAIRNVFRDPGQGSESALERVDSLKALLALLSEPQVKNVALCRKVATFGSYEQMPDEEFVSGRSIQTIVYAEIENLRAAPVALDGFETRLSTRLEILTADGKSMWQREEPEVIDRCRRARRDFFVAQRITLPPTLPVGQYVLKYSVEDKISGKIGEGTESFHLLSPISVAKGQ